MSTVSTFITTLSALKNKTSGVIWISAHEYPSFFFSDIRAYIARETSLSVVSLQVEDGQSAELQAQCATMFFSSQYCYVLGNVGAYSKRVRDQWLDYIATYTGPHLILFFAPPSLVQTVSKQWVVLEAPDAIALSDVCAIASALYATPTNRLEALTQALSQRVKQVSLDSLCLLYRYAYVLGNNVTAFAQDYLLDFVQADISLFSLSQAFFAKRKRAFYDQWTQIHQAYPLPFWIQFWSEQLWRAALFVSYMKQGKKNDARAIGGKRLPFAFMQTEWRRYTFEELQAMCHELYALDYETKNSGNPMALEYIYVRWFLS